MADVSDGEADPAQEAAESNRWSDVHRILADADAARKLSPAELELYATAGYLLGRTDTAIDAVTRSHRAHIDAGDEAQAVRAGFWIVFMLLGRGRMAQAEGWLARLRHLVSDLDPAAPERGYLDILHAFRLLAAERNYHDSSAMAYEATERGRCANDEDLVALGLTIHGRASLYDGRTEPGLRSLDEAMAGVISGGASPIVAGTVYCAVIDACEEIGERRRATEWTEALDRWCDHQSGMVTFTGQCLTHRARVHRRRGELEAAMEEAARACRRFEGAADDSATGAALYELAEVHRIRGDDAAAERAYQRAGEWGFDPQPGLALLRMAQGRSEAARRAMQRVVAETTEAVARRRVLPAQVEILLALGEDSDAGDAADELAALADRLGTKVLRAEAAMARGAVDLAAGDAAAALTSLRTAAEHWLALDDRYEAARTKALIGEACARLGDTDAAAIERESARRMLAAIGALRDLRALDDAAAPAHGLTGRELEVLRLVATGATNQQIGDRLHLATKTVDRHVSNILAKLGVPSRTAATAFAYERGLM